MKTTNLHIILDEANLTTLKDSRGVVKRFNTFKAANEHASNHLEVWQVVKVHFEHNFIQHLTGSQWVKTW